MASSIELRPLLDSLPSLMIPFLVQRLDRISGRLTSAGKYTTRGKRCQGLCRPTLVICPNATDHRLLSLRNMSYFGLLAKEKGHHIVMVTSSLIRHGIQGRALTDATYSTSRRVTSQQPNKATMMPPMTLTISSFSRIGSPLLKVLASRPGSAQG